MTRKAAREIAIRIIFGAGMNPRGTAGMLDNFFSEEYYSTLAAEDGLFSQMPDDEQRGYIGRVALGVGEHMPELDSYIEKYAKNWKIGRISRVAVAIMRTAMFEVMYMPDVPNAAAVNEAVEIAKKFEEPGTVSFINGILGGFIRGETALEV